MIFSFPVGFGGVYILKKTNRSSVSSHKGVSKLERTTEDEYVVNVNDSKNRQINQPRCINLEEFQSESPTSQILQQKTPIFWNTLVYIPSNNKHSMISMFLIKVPHDLPF